MGGTGCRRGIRLRPRPPVNVSHIRAAAIVSGVAAFAVALAGVVSALGWVSDRRARLYLGPPEVPAATGCRGRAPDLPRPGLVHYFTLCAV